MHSFLGLLKGLAVGSTIVLMIYLVVLFSINALFGGA